MGLAYNTTRADPEPHSNLETEPEPEPEPKSMNAAIRARLNALNRTFYARRAEAFSATRDHAWPGWSRVVDALAEDRAAESAPRVLDVGCGNGRFACHLDTAWCKGRVTYLGVDASAALLAVARERTRALEHVSAALEQRDVLDGALPEGPFDLVVAFGLLHHVPGHETREDLVRRLAERVAAGGLLALTVWRFASSERLRGRVIPWPEFNRGAAHPIDPAELESGDHLLGFGEPGGPPRYCHACDDDEVEALRERALAAGLVSEADFEADGRSGDLNRYLLLRRPERA